MDCFIIYNDFSRTENTVVFEQTITELFNKDYAEKRDNKMIYKTINPKFKNVILPLNLQVIHSYVFNDCFELMSIKIPESVTNIGSNVFSNCTRLSSVKLPSKLTILNNPQPRFFLE